MGNEVRSSSTVPGAADFVSGRGTPLVVHRTTGRGYVILDDDSIVPIGGTGFVNVRDYGASTSGTAAANKTAFQSALDSGYNVYFDGEYELNGPLTFSTNYQSFFGLGWGSKLKFTQTSGLFCALAIVQGTVGVQLRDFELQGNASTEPAGPAPVRGIVAGTNAAGTAHDSTAWTARVLVRNVHITGVTPGTTGFNLGMQFNKANKSRYEGGIIESIYGTSASFGYGIVCDANETDIVGTKFLSTISGQGRHAIYFTNTPSQSRAIDCYAEGFASEAFTSNISGGGGANIEYINCVAKDCMATETGTTAAVFAFSGGSNGRIKGCKVVGTLGSNRFGFKADTCPRTIISDCYAENIDRHAVYIVDSDGVSVHDMVLNGFGVEDTGLYGGVEIITSDYVDVHHINALATNARFIVRINSTAATPTYCNIRNLIYSGSLSYEVENAGINTSTNYVESRLQKTTAGDGDTTPSVAGQIRVLVFSNTNPTTVTTLDDARDGQIVVCRFSDSNTTLSADFYLAGGVSYTGAVNDTLTLAFVSPNWYEVARSNN